MAWLRVFVAVALTGLAASVSAQDLNAVCHASSSFDLTLRPGSLLFDRAAPAPRQVELQQGHLRTDGVTVALHAEDEDRLTLFEQQLRALVPRVRAIAEQAVDIAAQTLRQQAAQLQLSDATQAELTQRLAARQAEIKQRIAQSNSTHDWQPDAMQAYANNMASDLLPLVVNDLGQQAINAAMSGDLQGAAQLRDRASDLAAQLRPLLERRLQVLRPQVQALCPTIQRMAELQQGVRAADGRALDLLQVGH